MNVLVTGGAGFIGTNLVRRLLREGCEITVLDIFSPQVHGETQCLSSDLAGNVDLRIADVRDESAVSRALEGQDVIVHLAAETGTGQSMYEVLRYEDVNVKGTAVIMHCLMKCKNSGVQKVILASSRAVYGEGRYRCLVDGVVYPESRRVGDMSEGRFEVQCPICGAECSAEPTPEDSPLRPLSFYGLTKQIQEQIISLFSKQIGFSWASLRYQNVYGPGQSLKNPYTGILAIFSSQARLNQPINIFEDGNESRDFVYIDDVVEATWRCIGTRDTVGALNVGSGEPITVMEVVEAVTEFFSSNSRVSVGGAFREGDIRHCMADLKKAQALIEFKPHVHFGEGVRRFLAWARAEELAPNRYAFSLDEMRQRGLLHGG